MSLQSRYTILRKITDGGTAEIFLAKQHGAQGFEKMVVLKRIFTTFYADPQFRHLLVDECSCGTVPAAKPAYPQGRRCVLRPRRG